ncbi:oligosaccharide repeat unit polymerase [Longibaculum muris]|uniref:oligosaccharide repeat unit polymerase n=1 Tax=Longibaculum muris TaxID=1796628 RepID=UPI0012B7E93D|nr:oligosaccharide repeat unit polymerase [Longibaculum muris]
MFFLGYIILFSIELLLSINKFHKIINIVSIFTGIWCVFGAVSSLGLYDLRIPNGIVHVYAWLFVFIVDSIILTFMTNKKMDIERNTNLALSNNHRAFKIQLFSLILIVPMVLKVVSILLSSGSLSTIRQMYFSGNNFSSMYLDMLFRIIPMSLLNALIIYFVYFSFETKKRKYLYYSLFNTILVTIINGGRYAIILLLYSIIIMWITGNVDVSKTFIDTRYKKKIKKITMILVAIMILVTIRRGQELLKNIVIYFSGSLSYLDYILENAPQFALNQRLHGYLTFAAFIEPVVLLLKFCGLTTAKVPSYEFNMYCQGFHDIGNGNITVLFNANTSIIYYFLRDFGWIGIIIGAIFISLIIVKAYNKWQSGNRFYGMVFIYLVNILFNSLMTYQLVGVGPFFAILALYFITQRKFVFGKSLKKVGDQYE